MSVIYGEHKCEVVTIDNLIPHPNADRLAITYVWGYQVLVARDEWKIGDKAVYLPPDSVVSLDRPEFSWMADLQGSNLNTHRLRAKKMRGVWSQGMLVKVEDTATPGEDYSQRLNIGHYVPDMKPGTNGNNIDGPFAPIYKVEHFERYPNAFEFDENVVISEKIHGANAKYLFDGTNFWVGSHRTWKRAGIWHDVLEVCPGIKSACNWFKGCIFYGEVFGGRVQDLSYGRLLDFRLIDILSPEGAYFSWADVRNVGMSYKLERVPGIDVVRYKGGGTAEFEKYRSGKSLIVGAENIREGVVLRGFNNAKRFKFVSNDYYMRSR